MDKYNSKFASAIGNLYGESKWAITTSGKTTRYSVPKESVTAKWRRHENTHKNQFIKYGWIPFVLMYIWETVKNGYYNNKYEVEAREKENVQRP